MSRDLIFTFKRSLYRDQYFAALGRAVSFATRFENNCRLLCELVELKYPKSKSVSRVSLLTEENIALLCERVEKWQLNDYIQKAVSRLALHTSIDTALRAAREARNTLTHESAIGIEDTINESEEDDLFLDHLGQLVRPIAEADIVVFVILAKETHEPIPRLDYLRSFADRVVDWVCKIDFE